MVHYRVSVEVHHIEVSRSRLDQFEDILRADPKMAEWSDFATLHWRSFGEVDDSLERGWRFPFWRGPNSSQVRLRLHARTCSQSLTISSNVQFQFTANLRRGAMGRDLKALRVLGFAHTRSAFRDLRRQLRGLQVWSGCAVDGRRFIRLLVLLKGGQWLWLPGRVLGRLAPILDLYIAQTARTVARRGMQMLLILTTERHRCTAGEAG